MCFVGSAAIQTQTFLLFSDPASESLTGMTDQDAELMINKTNIDPELNGVKASLRDLL